MGASDIFLVLGNTGSATHRRVVADEVIRKLPRHIDSRPLRTLLPADSVRSLTQYRHPDPDIHADHKLSHDNLQVLGSWQKIKLPRGSSIPGRMAFASFIWKSNVIQFGQSFNLKCLILGCIF